ncbi:hypothetical protein LOTGIDRAFT_169003 [Lottia gigantea]|uniref:EF-hand domain-containing protein n=1 Tax=Lottia gigantea TaxID=225164 RepID=V3ZMU3_LOTGI|nr:hypothetical protein LOTGIDRAFT_169003 [Lottia gigantea]ESO83765.1 hypothetical protein LOTGIDRAFT_169003 [Lottia gigantea]
MFVLALVICSVAVAVNAAPTQAPIDVKERLKQSFKTIDANGNGIAEFGEFQVLVKGFDANQDGKITLEEYAAAVHSDVATMGPIFHAIDANHNNSLDDFDVKFAVNMFDSDNNGQVTQDEFVLEYSKFIAKIMANTMPKV